MGKKRKGERAHGSGIASDAEPAKPSAAVPRDGHGKDDTSSEVAPRFTLLRVPNSREAGKELLELNVSLPGVATEGEVSLKVSDRRLSLRVPGQFRLELLLDVQVRETPAMVKLFKRRSLYVVELDVVSSGASVSTSQQAAPPAAASAEASSVARVSTSPMSANRGPPASTSSDPRFRSAPGAAAPSRPGSEVGGSSREPVIIAVSTTAPKTPAEPPAAAAPETATGDGKQSAAASLAAGLRRGFLNRAGGGTSALSGRAGAAASASDASAAAADPSLSAPNAPAPGAAPPAGEEPAGPKKRSYPELSPPVMSRVAVALSKVVEATRVEVTESKPQQQNSVLMNPAARRANAAKRAAAAEAHEAGMQALREGDAKRAVPLLGRAIALCPEEYTPLYEKIKEQVLIAGERMGQSAVDAELRGFAPGSNPLRALLPSDSSASASAKAAAELIIETATAQFEEKRGPKAMDAMIAAAAMPGAQGVQRVMGPEPPPAGAAAVSGLAAPPGGPIGNGTAGEAAAAAAKGVASVVSGTAKAGVRPSAESAAPLPADYPSSSGHAFKFNSGEPSQQNGSPHKAHAAASGCGADSNGDGAGADHSDGDNAKDDAADDNAPLERSTWPELALALWNEWCRVLAEALPIVPELFGWERSEYFVRRVVAPGSRSRPFVLGLVLLLAAVSVTAVLALLAHLARVALEWTSLGLVSTGQALFAVWDAVAWSPQWWAAIPACAFFALQSRFAALRVFWAAPFWWWLLGGGWWAAVGSFIAVFNRVLLGSIPFWLTLLGWPILRASARVSSRLWVTIPLVLAVVTGWGLLFLLWLVANARVAQDSSSGPLLASDVPADAEGEVARVLGCRDYFSVLGIDATADKDAVKRAYKSKVLLVHPDKCQGSHAAAAFRRVNDANTLLSDDSRRAEYIQQLLDFAAQKERPAVSAGREDGAADDGALRPGAAGVRPRSVPKKAGARRR